MAVFKDMLKDDNIIGALRQQYDNMIWLYNQANSVLNNPNATEEELKQARADLDVATSSLSNKDGFIYVGNDENFNAWINAQAEQYFEDSEYRHTATSSNSSVTTSYDPSTITAITTNRANQAINQFSPGVSTTQGPNITYKAMPFVGTYNAASIMQLLYH